ncbi:hypothetical protein [Actinomadura alba]|uniref:Uncharacterized protein n=1 Tax=Actinomadura alba TaxID=406431 RepID=A0ABR7LWI0_9ACTN|nr:hypothetical protein [Actinomadura alba]MBC6468778.1 hypothetical protein [Actinomadura alba]
MLESLPTWKFIDYAEMRAELSRIERTSGSPEAKRLRKTITPVAVPKINPDGTELDRRGPQHHAAGLHPRPVPARPDP